MIDIKYFREKIDILTKALQARNVKIDPTQIIELDNSRKELIYKAEQLRARQNRVSKEIAALKKKKENADQAIEEMRIVREQLKELDEGIRNVNETLRATLLTIPNLPHESVPVGPDESANRVERQWGEPPKFDFIPKDHVDIAENLHILDLSCAAKISGARFSLLYGAGARLERALIQFMLDTHTKEHGYTEVLPPFLVNSASMEGSGQLPKFYDEAFTLENRDLWLVPTAEVPLTNIFRDEIIQEKDLPACFVAYTPCFRSEAGSYGKDTRGMMRQHQFNKVELYKFCHPETSWEELEKLLSDAETILQKLELPYQVVTLCTGDLGFSAAKTYDLEVWLPGQNTYREISSCSNCVDFQARRANIRFRPNGKGKPQFVHTLNGSGLAVGRTLIAILENYQQEDGTVKVPKVLQKYMDGLEVIR